MIMNIKSKIVLSSIIPLSFIWNSFALDNYFKAPFIDQQIIHNNWTFCWNEGSICQFNGIKKVLYVSTAHPNKYIIKNWINHLKCDNSTFWDPDFWSWKKCYFFDKNIDIEKIKHRFVYNDKMYIITDDKSNVIFKNFAGETMAIIPNFKMDYSSPFNITDNYIIIARTSVNNPKDYIELSDGTNTKYNKFLYISKYNFYDKTPLLYKIWISKDVSFVSFIGDQAYVYYTDNTAELMTLDFSTKTVKKENTNFDEIWKNKLVNVWILGDNSLFYSVKNKNFVISTDDGYTTISGLNNVNYQDLNSLNVIQKLSLKQKKVISVASVIVNWTKYIMDVNDPTKFVKEKNNITYNGYSTIDYNTDTNILNYNINNIFSWYKKLFTIDLNSIYPVQKCWKFNYVNNTGDFVNVVFDKCIYRLSNYTNWNIIDNTLLPFYSSYFKKFKYISNLNNNVDITISKNTYEKVDYKWKKIWLKDYKRSWMSYDSPNPNYINVEYTKNGVSFSRKNTNKYEYTTIWFKDPNLRVLNWLKISYDVKFSWGSKWGWITIWNIPLDICPARIWFRGPEKYIHGLDQNKSYHIDIVYSLVNVTPLQYNVSIYVDGKLLTSEIYNTLNIEKDLLEQGIWLRSNYYKGKVDYSNIHFKYIKYAKDKAVYNLLKINDYFKLRTQLNNIDQSNKLIDRLITAYKKAYLLSIGINVNNLKANSDAFRTSIKTILNNNSYYKKEIQKIDWNISLDKLWIEKLKYDIFQKLPIVFDNTVFSFTEKNKLDLSKKLSDLSFINTNINKSEINSFNPTIQWLINKEIKYKQQIINSNYKLDRINNALDYTLHTANVMKFLDKFNNSSNNPSLKINWENIKVSDLISWLSKWFNSFINWFNNNSNLPTKIFFTSDYDLNKFLVPNIKDNFVTTITWKDWKRETVFDKTYFDLYGLTTWISKWTSNKDYNNIFINNKLYLLLSKYTPNDIINTIKNHNDLVILKYTYDNKNVTKDGAISMTDFIENFYNKDKSKLYKDDNNDGKNDYNLEDVLLDMYSKLTDNTDDNKQQIHVSLWKDPSNALNLFSLLSFKKYLEDNNISFTNSLKNWSDLQKYTINSLNKNVINAYDNLKKVYNNILQNYWPEKYKDTISKYNKLINFIKLGIKSKKLSLIDNNGNIVDGNDLSSLEGMSLEKLSSLSVESSSYNNNDNINWDFFEKYYIPYYKKNWFTEQYDLITSYEKDKKDLDNLNKDKQNVFTNYANSLNNIVKWLTWVVDNSNISFSWGSNDLTGTSIMNTLNKLSDNYIKKNTSLLNTDIDNAFNKHSIDDNVKLNISNFWSLEYLIAPDKYSSSGLNYKTVDEFNNDITKYWINEKIIKKIDINNISQYSKYQLPKTKWFNEYYWVLNTILETKKDLLIWDKYYNNTVEAINKIDTFKNSKTAENLDDYISYLKDSIKKNYYTNIIDLYNSLKELNNGEDFDFKLQDYINNISWLVNKIKAPTLTMDFSKWIWNNSWIEYNPAKKVYINPIYDSLIKMIDDKINNVNPHINYNKAWLNLNSIAKQVDQFEKNYNNELYYNWINKEKTLLIWKLNSINLKNIKLDVSKLNKQKHDLLNRINKIYLEKIKQTKSNISDYFYKTFNSQIGNLYSQQNINDLKDSYLKILINLWKIANTKDNKLGVNNIIREIKLISNKNIDDINKEIVADKCVVNSSENWNWLRSSTGVCGSIIDKKSINWLFDKAKSIYKQQIQQMSNSKYSSYFPELLALNKNALDEIFDWNNMTLKDNPDIKIITKADWLSQLWVFKSSNCSFIIYKNSILLWLECDKNIQKLDLPMDNSGDSFNNIVLSFKNTLWMNNNYSLIKHYNDLQSLDTKHKWHYKSVFLKLTSKDGNKTFYLKSFYIPNGISWISIKNENNVFMQKTFKTPFLTKSWTTEVTSSIENSFDQLSKNGKPSDDNKSLIFNDPLLTTFLNNNIGYLINKIKLVSPLLPKPAVSSLYKNLAKIIVNKLWMTWINTQEKIIELNKEKNDLFNILNMINNTTFNTYESWALIIKKRLEWITYFTKAKDYLSDLLWSKINAFNWMKNSLLFQKKINEINTAINWFSTHIADKSLDWINKLKTDITNLINKNFSDQNIKNSLLTKLNNRYNQTKVAIETNIKYSSSYIDSNQEIQWRTEANNVLTNTFDNNFVEQLSMNNILKDDGIISIQNNKYVINNKTLSNINKEVNNNIVNPEQISISNISNVTWLKDNVMADNILKSKNVSDIKKKMLGFIYVVLKNWKYNVPVDVTSFSTDDKNFFKWVVTPDKNHKDDIKSIQYESIKWIIKDANGNIIWNKNTMWDINIYIPNNKVELNLPNKKYLVVVKNMSDSPVDLQFYSKDVDGNLKPIYMNNFVVTNIAKFTKNFNNNINGLKTQELDITK